MKIHILQIIVGLLILGQQITYSQEVTPVKDPSTIANEKMLEVYANYFGKTGNTSSPSFSSAATSGDYELVDNYIIQLGAFKSPDATRLNRLRQYGTIFTEQKDNLTIYKLGFFLSKLRAEEVLGLAQKEGFKGAFINQVRVRKQKAVVPPPPDTVEKVQSKPPTQDKELIDFFKKSIKEDLTTIKNEFAQTGRYRVIKIIRLLKIPLSPQEQQRWNASQAYFYPEKSTLGKVYSYRSVTSIQFKSRFTETRNIGPVLEANVIDLGYSENGYTPEMAAKLKKHVEDLKAMIQVNDEKGLKLNQIFDKALELDQLVKNL